MGRRKGRRRRHARDDGSVGAEALRRSSARIRRRARDFPDLPPDSAWPDPVRPAADPRDLLGRLRDGDGDGPRARARLVCGECREFVPDDDAGRGRCLHPGSGVLSPWPDTEACQFHAARRR